MPHLDDILDPIAKSLTGTAPESTPLPATDPDPKIILDHIAEVSRNARATWFGLFALLVFIGVTLLGHKDADFFTHGAETQLLLGNITVPVEAFFYVTPVLVAALYIHLHLYLMSLSDALADAPARIGDKPLADRVYPWNITRTALWYRNRRRKRPDGDLEGCAAPRSMSTAMGALSLFLGSVGGILVVGLLWWRSMPAHNEWLTLWIGLWFFAAALAGSTGLASTARSLAGTSRDDKRRNHVSRWAGRIAGVAFLAVLSWETTEGGILSYRITKADGSVELVRLIPLYPANLREAVLSTKPENWQTYRNWSFDFYQNYRASQGLGQFERLNAAHIRNLWDTGPRELTVRHAALTGPDLHGRDLRGADMTGAILSGADLRGARLDGAVLRSADLQGAQFNCLEPAVGKRRCASLRGVDLVYALMHGADLRGAQMQGADLRQVRMDGADLSGAQLQGVDLRQARMRGALLNVPRIWIQGLIKPRVQEAKRDAPLIPMVDPNAAQLQGADLGGAVLNGAYLNGVQMQGADLSRAQMAGAYISGAQMQGANLTEANMTEADLSKAQMQDADLSGSGMRGAVLSGAQMQGANLSGAEMRGAVLSGAQMQGANLSEAKLRGAVLDGAQMHGANLSGAQMQGAVLSMAEMQDADCGSANLAGALLRSAIVTCKNLTQEQLEYAVGDLGTVLPDGLTVASCLETLPEDVEWALVLHPKEGISRPSRAEICGALLCDRDKDSNLTEQPRRVGIQAPPEQ